MYALDYTELLIIPFDGVNDHRYKSNDTFETYEEAKEHLLSYWITLKEDASRNIELIKNL
ncbi:hypothetical protein [uncultured Tenacibaculum sp.]|uniref:hypothetical protein n=1 Tax=uncultured Tenacibaculum sp. TaxID=174713 RepID=UPI00261B274B|nr:hypothetical protein [uncultured Tenacibaculum sp.]